MTQDTSGARPAASEIRPRAVAAANSDDEARAVGAWLNETVGCDVIAVATSGPAALDLAVSREPHIVLAPLDLAGLSGVALAEQLWARAPSVGVVLVADSLDVDAKQALRAGALDLVHRPLDHAAAESIRAALAEVGRRRALLAASDGARTTVDRRERELGKLVAVVSAKGGVGRSFVAANIASWLAKTSSTVLCDLDLQFGDVSGWGADSPPERTIDHLAAVVGAGELQLDDVRAIGQSRFDGVILLPGTRSPMEGVAWATDRGARTQRLLQALRGWFPWVVVDSLPGLLEPVVGISRAASAILVVTGADVGSIRATQRYLDLLDRFAPAPRLVIVNRADRGESVALVREALKRERLAFVKEDRTFARRLVVEGLAAPQQRQRGVARALARVATDLQALVAARP